MTTDPSATTRIVTWNLWWRFGPWEARAAGIERTLSALRADVICLQEVWSHEGVIQSELLAEALGFHSVSSLTGRPGGLGNAVLSRWPIGAHDVTPLPLTSGEPGHRSVVRATLEAPFGPLDVHCTHLAYRFDESGLRARQLDVVVDGIARRRAEAPTHHPPVLCGDLNATPDSTEIRRLTGRDVPYRPELVFTDAWAAAGRGSGHTWDNRNPHLTASTWPRRRLDYVLVGWPRDKPTGNPVRARLAGARPHDGVWPSDHLAVVVDLHRPDAR